MKRWVCELLFWRRGTLVYIGKKVTAPNGHYPTFQHPLVALFQVPTTQLLQPLKIQQCGGAKLPSCSTRSKVGRATFAFQTWSHSPLHSASEISSNRSIERLGFMLISVFQFFILQNWFCLQQYKTHAMRKVVKWADPFWPYRPKVE